MTVERIPAGHRDLLDRLLHTILTTEMPDGRFQTTVVWCNRDGDDVLLNTMREFQKARNLDARPRATVLVADPDVDRWIEIRGTVTVAEFDPIEHLDELSRRYAGRSPYFGEVVDRDLAATEHPVSHRLTPARIVTGPVASVPSAAPDPTLPPLATAPAGCPEEATIPRTHRDLLERPIRAALSTRLPHGAAQTQVVWCEPDGTDVLLSTTRERRRGRNLEADPRATLLVIDPADGSRWIEIRADVTLTTTDAVEVADRLARGYTTHDRFYGGVYALGQRDRETRVTARLHPRRIVCDAIHG